MSDVFLSYARADQAKIEQLAAALKERGFSLWWDRQIEGGRHFAKDIEREITAAKAVIVAWSEHSIESHWVLDEASYARDEGKLLPISLDGIMPPLGYRQIQSIDFVAWPTDSSRLDGLLRALTLLTGEDASRNSTLNSAATPSPLSGKRKSLVLASAGAIALALAGGGYLAFTGFPGGGAAQASESVGLAILPFKVTGDASEAERQLGSGLAEVLNSSLSGLPRLALTSNLSTAQLIDEGQTIAEIGKQLNVGHVVEGQVRFEGSDAILTLALIDAATSRKIWSETFREDRRSISLLTMRFTTELGSVLRSRFGVGQGRLADNSNVDQNAYEAYLRGMQHLWARAVFGNRQQGFLELTQATRLAPDFADAHAALAFLVITSNAWDFSLSLTEWQEVAEAATRRALALDPENLLAQVADYMVPATFGGEIAGAIEGFEQLVRDHPDYAPAQYLLGYTLASVGEHQQAIVHYREALRIDPVDPIFNAFYGESLLALGDYPELRRRAMECTDCLIAIQYWLYGLIWVADDRQFAQDYERLFERWAAEGGGDPREIEEARRVGIAVRERRPFAWRTEPDPDFVLAVVAYDTVGDYQAALDQLDRYPYEVMPGYQLILLLDIPRDELPEAVRADPRYHAPFANPGIQSIVAERRRRGHLRNLPVFPVKAYEGP
ncbi:TIR domain-containing protein [Altererythrobacter litoralis]|uniref:TIR domain-containing protein n=1 Tax=Altererythrobacter litoralis TaxID=3113904 RepID=A0ABU7GE32_9SPHN|nr:TIR domain-containing protein [Erythrobacteraceae bacterium 1XM1-14]